MRGLPAAGRIGEPDGVTAQTKHAYEIGTQLADDPLVVVVDDFVTPAETRHLINQARQGLTRGKVTGDEGTKISAGRTGRVTWIKHDKTPIVRGLVKRVSDVVGIPVSHAESLQVVHYAEDQEYRAHHDSWDLSTEKGQTRTAKSGQRLVTALMYLNEVEAGGATGFPKLKLEVEPVPGRMVLFHNTTERGDLHVKSLHGGLPVIAGEKWACNLWFRAEPYVRPGARARPAHAARKNPRSSKRAKSQKAARRRNR